MLKSKRIQLTKKDISKKINIKIGLSNSYTDKITEDLIFILKDLIKSNDINIKNFGSFKVVKKNERIGRNPKNKETHIIESRRSIKFKSSKNFNDKINDI